MNIINKLTLRHLKENKKRTVVTIIGIIISVAMITATCVSVTSLIHVFAQSEAYTGGNWHIELENADAGQIEKLEQNEDLQYVGVCKTPELGNQAAVRVDSGKKASVSVGDILAGNRDYFSAMFTASYQGKLPANENEIVVTREFLDKNGLSWQIGDTVRVELGRRIVKDTTGALQQITGSYAVGETFESGGPASYTLVGIAEKSNFPSGSAVLFRGLSQAEQSGGDVYLTAETLDKNTLDVLKNALTKAGIAPDYTLHVELFRYNYVILENDATMATLLSFSSVIMAIIIIASVMLIYNAFGISVSERSRYLGMLASVGATKAQKRRSVYFEGAVLGAFGIPLGFLAGIGGMAVTFRVLDPVFAKSGLNYENTHFTLSFPWWIIPVIALLSIITIAISAYIPARRASRTTPIDALRQNTDVRVKAKKLRSPILVRKIFGYEGELAYKNMKRNGRKSRIITSSLALSIVLFLSVYSFCDMFSEATRLSAQNPYQVYAYVDLQDTDRFREEVSELGNFDKMYSVNATYGMGLTTAKDNFVNGYDRMFSSEEGGFPLYLCYVDDNDFNAMCEENGINPKPFYKGNSMVVMNCMEHTSSAAKIFSDSIIGTTFSSTKDANDPLTGYTVGALVPYRDTSYVYNLAAPVYVMAFAPVSAANLTGVYMIGFETTQHEAFSEDVQDILENGNYADSGVMDMVSSIEMMNSTTLIMQVFLYGFITLMALISVANIFNTVSTSIDLRRKEFAMLKSVGVTPKGFNRMLRFESLFYGLKALIFGLPLGLLCSYFMQQILVSGSFDIAFYPDWRVYLGVTLAVFLIVGMSMWYATSKVKKDTIVETLKTEIN